jgi:hypothetical protein
VGILAYIYSSLAPNNHSPIPLVHCFTWYQRSGFHLGFRFRPSSASVLHRAAPCLAPRRHRPRANPPRRRQPPPPASATITGVPSDDATARWALEATSAAALERQKKKPTTPSSRMQIESGPPLRPLPPPSLLCPMKATDRDGPCSPTIFEFLDTPDTVSDPIGPQHKLLPIGTLPGDPGVSADTTVSSLVSTPALYVPPGRHGLTSYTSCANSTTFAPHTASTRGDAMFKFPGAKVKTKNATRWIQVQHKYLLNCLFS